MNLSADPENLFLLEQLAEQTDNVIFLYDAEQQQLKYVSPAFEEVWECSRQNLLSGFAGLMQTIFPGDRMHVLRSWHWYKRTQRSTHKTFEFRLGFPDGRLKWIYAELFLLRQENKGLVISGWVREVTERKNNLEVLRKYASRKNSMLEILSHDLAGFLSMIRNLTSSIDLHAGQPEMAEVRNKLDLIRETSRRGSELIRNLVNHEFIESAAESLNRQRMDLVEKLTDLVNMYRSGQGNLKNTFLLETTSPHIYAQVDDVKFMQVANNLLSNAIKFTPDGGTIKVSLDETPTTVLFQFSDTGIGIPEELHPILFERYSRASRPGLRDEPTNGLGMSIIKGIVEQHGGRIWFCSRENEGTTFFIELPKE